MFYNFPQVSTNSVLATQLIPILKDIFFWGEVGGGGGGGGCKANFLLAILNNINQCPRQQLGQLKQVPAMAGINIECLRHTQLD